MKSNQITVPMSLLERLHMLGGCRWRKVALAVPVIQPSI